MDDELNDDLSPRTCDVCGATGQTYVSALVGIPMTVARCGRCLDVGAVPYGILIANTAMIGGMEQAAEWWQETVADTLARLDITRPDFNHEVEQAIRCMDADLREVP